MKEPEEVMPASGPECRPWMKSFGKLHDLHEETLRIERLIDEEFEQIGAEDCE